MGGARVNGGGAASGRHRFFEEVEVKTRGKQRCLLLGAAFCVVLMRMEAEAFWLRVL